MIAQLYKEHWKVELVFKWIKQHLLNKAFGDTSYNVVCCHIWIAKFAYLLVSITKKLNLEKKIYSLFQTFSLPVFEKTIIDGLFVRLDYGNKSIQDYNQLTIFDLGPIAVILKSNLEIIKRIPQHYITSFLGITPVSLSRIRNKR